MPKFKSSLINNLVVNLKALLIIRFDRKVALAYIRKFRKASNLLIDLSVYFIYLQKNDSLLSKIFRKLKFRIDSLKEFYKKINR